MALYRNHEGVRALDDNRMSYDGWEDDVDVDCITCSMPKHQGESWVDIVDYDRSYIDWLVNGDNAPDLPDELLDTLEKLLEATE